MPDVNRETDFPVTPRRERVSYLRNDEKLTRRSRMSGLINPWLTNECFVSANQLVIGLTNRSTKFERRRGGEGLRESSSRTIRNFIFIISLSSSSSSRCGTVGGEGARETSRGRKGPIRGMFSKLNRDDFTRRTIGNYAMERTFGFVDCVGNH